MIKKYSYKVDNSGNSGAIFMNDQFQIKKRDIVYLKKKSKK